MMKIHPTSFSPPMVIAILQNRKFQTRRLSHSGLGRDVAVGDRLWVKEGFLLKKAFDAAKPLEVAALGNLELGYVADFPPSGPPESGGWGKARVGYTMPKVFSRLVLTVTEVRRERLLDISEADALAEGVVLESADPPFYYIPGIHPHSITGVGIEEPGAGHHAARSYWKLWDHINGPGRAAKNPEVTAITFTAEAGNILNIIKRDGLEA